jgi:hypothetical protein
VEELFGIERPPLIKNSHRLKVKHMPAECGSNPVLPWAGSQTGSVRNEEICGSLPISVSASELRKHMISLKYR